MGILAIIGPAFLQLSPELRAEVITAANKERVANAAAQQRWLAAEFARWGRAMPGVYKHRCWECESIFYATRPYARYCSNPCGKKAAIARRDRRRQLAREHVCAQCNQPFTARSDAKFCGDRCRQRHHRSVLELVPEPVSVTESVKICANQHP
jgi:hypothetical protein